jgi:hypothetical protein
MGSSSKVDVWMGLGNKRVEGVMGGGGGADRGGDSDWYGCPGWVKFLPRGMFLEILSAMEILILDGDALCICLELNSGKGVI